MISEWNFIILPLCRVLEYILSNELWVDSHSYHILVLASFTFRIFPFIFCCSFFQNLPKTARLVVFDRPLLCSARFSSALLTKQFTRENNNKVIESNSIQYRVDNSFKWYNRLLLYLYLIIPVFYMYTSCLFDLLLSRV